MLKLALVRCGYNVRPMVACASVLLFWALPLIAQESKLPSQAEFDQKVQPLLAKYCHQCHGEKNAKSVVNLTLFRSPREIAEGRKVWLEAVSKVQSHEMPPPDAPAQPTKAERALLVEWLTATLANNECRGTPEPGRVTLRRLTRYEYRNTVKDLTGVDYALADDFPGDDVGYGFDNIGDVLSLPPILLEKYLAAADDIASRAIFIAPPVEPFTHHIVAAEMKVENGQVNDVGLARRGLMTNATLSYSVNIPRSAEYEIRIEGGGDQAGNEPPQMGLVIDGKQEKQFAVNNNRKTGQFYTFRRRFAKGSHKIGVSFLNDYYNDKDPPNKRDRNLIVHNVHISGPFNASGAKLPASHEKIIFVKPDAKTPRRDAAEKVVRRLASWAFRRPATDYEVRRLVALTEQSRTDGETYEQGIQLALRAILVSPHFLFKVELDPPGKEGQPRNLTDLEVATRLSYFLWSCGPDAQLLGLAVRGELLKGNHLEEQARRLLKDTRSKALIENFVSQWLQLNNLEGHKPHAATFPDYDAELAFAMRRETEIFVWTVLRDDQSIIDLLSTNFTFVNQRLARLYGIRGVEGDQFQRVATTGTRRGGLLTQAALLTVTSNPNRTSPVKRGKFILDNILGAPLPPPPPNVPEFKPGERAGTLRQQLEQHRTNPLCASCHQRMDPLGFALENFDPIGRWRDKDGSTKIDASGKLPSGEDFVGPEQLNKLLMARKDQFVECLAEKLMTYALGRGLEYYDQCAVEKIVKNVKAADYRFSSVVLEIVKSDPFLKKGSQRKTP